MPAITVPDLTVLPRLEPPALGARSRPVRSRTTAPSGFEGEGFPVRRAFWGVDTADLDPFIHMDQMGEVEYVHRDSVGGGGVIADGDTQWMTAGSGLLHIEAPPEELVVSGGLFHGLQLWVNLPRQLKMADPRYQDIRGGEVALMSSADGGSLIRVIAGGVAGHQGPGVTHTPISIVHASLEPGAQIQLPWNPGFNALVYALSGSGQVGPDGVSITGGQLVVLGAGDYIEARAAERQDSHTPSLELYVLGGQPIREPVAAYGPFVMNTQAELVQAFEDFHAGRLGVIPPTSRHGL